MAELRYQAGADSLFELLDAQHQRISAESETLQAKVDQATALVALYKALAGDFAERSPTDAAVNPSAGQTNDALNNQSTESTDSRS